MGFSCLENHAVEDRRIKESRIKGSIAVHSDRMIRTTDVNRKQSALYTSPEEKNEEGGLERNREEIFVSCNMLKPSNQCLGVSPFSPLLVFLATEVQ